jgi:electron transport complex protein RnfC
MKGLDGVEIRTLPPTYPQGQKNVLLYNVTGRVIPEGEQASDIGCLIINCSTVAVIAKYIQKGIPFVSRCVTVDGPAVNTPKNVIAPIGTPVRELFEFCGGLRDGVEKITLGGPMTGTAIPNVEVPIVKTTNAVIAFLGKRPGSAEISACINCGRCVKMCPMRLLPPFIEKAFELKKTEQLKKFKADMCVECGCCAYVCPSKRPLAQVMSLSKKILQKAEAK